MNVRKWILLGITTLSASTLVGANYCYEPCDPCCDPCGGLMDGWTVYADWIYWRTRRSDLDYAVDTQFVTEELSGLEGNLYSVCPDWESGFRVGVEKACDCWVLGAEYTWYRHTSSSSADAAVASSLAGTRFQSLLSELAFGDITHATGSYKLDYDVVQLTMGSDVCWNECIGAHIYTGFKYASIDQKFTASYYDVFPVIGATNSDIFTSKADMQAYGLTFGINPTYKVFDCLDVFGQFSVDAYAADIDRSARYQNVLGEEVPLTRSDIKDKGCWDLIGTVNLGVGVTYVMENPCGCGDFALSVGYEFHEWINSPGFLTPSAVAGDVSIDRHNSDLGFDGLFVRLAATF